MEKTTFGLLAAVGALAISPALASAPSDAVDRILNPRSVAELLEPVPQPVETLANLDAAKQLEPVEVADAELNLGPVGVRLGHRHHHHHFYHHHHHHHHHFYRHHHHHHFYHHHHHHNF